MTQKDLIERSSRVLRRAWTGDLSLTGYIVIYIAGNITMAGLSFAVLSLGIIGASGSGLLIALGMLIGSALASSGVMAALMFGRGLIMKQRRANRATKICAWMVLVPHSTITLFAVALFGYLAVGTAEVLIEVWSES